MANPAGPCLRGTKEGIAEVEQAGEDEGGSFDPKGPLGTVTIGFDYASSKDPLNRGYLTLSLFRVVYIHPEKPVSS